MVNMQLLTQASTFLGQQQVWLGWQKFSKKKLATKELYGDGDLQLLLVNDKGFTGTIGMTASDEDYEEALRDFCLI